MKKTNFDELKELLLKDPETKREYDALEEEYNLISSLIDARNEANITQVELAKRTGINQSNISKIENGTGNPSFNTLQKIARGLNKKLEIKFV